MNSRLTILSDPANSKNSSNVFHHLPPRLILKSCGPALYLRGWHGSKNTMRVNIGAYDLQGLGRDQPGLRNFAFGSKKFEAGQRLSYLKSDARGQGFNPHAFADRMKVIDTPRADHSTRAVADA